MTLTQHHPKPLSLPAIHAHWTAALTLPPTAQLSNLRRLVRAVTKGHHPALRPLSLAALCPLYLDLALAYAFQGEYYLASEVFKEAVDSDATNAVAWFGLGLAQAQLGEWRNARRSWKNCLRCFESINGQKEGISYVIFQPQDEAASEEAGQVPQVGLDFGVWTLERTRVEFNFRLALLEKGSKKLGVAPRPAGQKRPGLNGLLAGLRFGPGWDANLQSFDSPLLPQHSGSLTEDAEDGTRFSSNPKPAAHTPPSLRTSHSGATLGPRISSRKPLPALPQTPPAPTPPLADAISFNDHKHSLDEDPFTSSPEKPILDPLASSPQTLTTQSYEEYHARFSRQSTLFTPEDQYFHDQYDGDDDESSDTYSAIDDTIATWSSFGQVQEGQTEEEQIGEHRTEEDEAEERELAANEPHEATTPSHPDFADGEILKPLVFEGFGSSSQER
ncbi:hypothetical protein IMSHALPRED_003030 [Imshaugia aleurites]|uniref:Uncharacterized protein n=1 Tax=Imshaugia aleurites TaxID=172621 RepID=A0A8H3F339_9LECA|nr:hypothetical protein IMSHALPRED_003030 [Imshaugia aleurites]